MLDLVRRAERGLTASEVVEATGLHPSTVRAHLDQLFDSGLLTRHRRGDGTPGRPAWHYQAVPRPDGGDGPGHGADRPYRELAAAVVEYLARDADDPHTAGVRAGRSWGRALAAPLAGSTTRIGPVDGLVRVLDQVGFAPDVVERPDPSSTVVHLRSCPFLELALANPDVVCGIHQGVIGGALGALGASISDTDLQPFAAPGACVVRVRTAAALRRPARTARRRPGSGADQ
jgi:predicted ArsR family transcriptional regulator